MNIFFDLDVCIFDPVQALDKFVLLRTGAQTEVMVSRSVSVWQYVKLSNVSLGTRPGDRLVADEDVSKQSLQQGGAAA